MTPAPPPPDPDLTQRALDVAEWSAKLAAAGAVVWGLVEKVGKPYAEWRRARRVAERNRLATDLREILLPELERLSHLEEAIERLESLLGDIALQNDRVLSRQHALFEDVDDFMVVARTNTERIDETNDLLDEVFHLDRRVNSERRKQIDGILQSLSLRQQARRRDADAEVPKPMAKGERDD